MLKLKKEEHENGKVEAAAFGRLCVETFVLSSRLEETTAAAFGRLCVETISEINLFTTYPAQPPSGGCVLKLRFPDVTKRPEFAAAFGRLCVETRQSN